MDNSQFYVQGRGFIEVGNLFGDKLISVNSKDLIIEDYHIELTDNIISVYNFQVKDFHTYFVGASGIWVHNSECEISKIEYRKTSKDDTVSFGDGEETVTYRRVQGGDGSSNSSQQKITLNDDGSISISNKGKNLNVSIDNGE